ncbi:hypothetical protein [Streptomyces chartreusis]
MAVYGGHGPSRTLHALRRRLGTRLPIDYLTTHYPDRYQQVLLNIDLDATVHEALCREAAALGLRPQELLGRRLRAAVARDSRERARRLEEQLGSVLAHYTPEEVLSGVARRLGSQQRHCTPPAP